MLISSLRVSGVFNWTSFCYPKNRASELLRNTATNILHHGYTNLGLSVAWATQFYTVSPSICVSLLTPRKCVVTCSSFLTVDSTVWNLPYVTLLAPRILRWLLDFRKFVDPCPTQCENKNDYRWNNTHNDNMLSVFVIFLMVCEYVSVGCSK